MTRITNNTITYIYLHLKFFVNSDFLTICTVSITRARTSNTRSSTALGALRLPSREIVERLHKFSSEASAPLLKACYHNFENRSGLR